MTYGDSIAVVVVMYNPSDDDIRNVRKIASQHYGVIVDNSVSYHSDSDAIGKMHYIHLGENRGIAEAQNIGIKKVSANSDVKYIVFLDQDSRCDSTYIESIAKEYKRIHESVPGIGILGPTVRNLESGETYHSAIHKDQNPIGGFINRREVISSGACVSMKLINEIGLFDERLFIDFVDFELCWRARQKGYLCGITDRLILNHKVGKREISLGAYKIIISAPQRYYYQYRNHLLLCSRSYVPMQWKIATGIKHAARIIYLPIVLKNGMQYLRNMIKGIKDGLTR